MLHIGRNVISLVLSRVLSGVVLFLIYTQLLQYLGPEAAGHFGLLSSYLTVFAFFVDLGMSHLVIKKMSEDSTHISKYLTNYFLVQFLLGLFFMLVMDGFVLFADYPAHVKSALYVTGFGLLLSSLSLPFRAVIVAKQKLTINAQVNFFNAFINSAIMLLAIALEQGVFFLAFISVTVSVFDLIVYGYIVNKRFARFTLDFDKTFIKQLFIMNLPFMGLTLFSVYNRIDGLMLPHFRSFVETGYYAAAYKFWDTLAFFPGILGISLYPFFAQMLSLGKRDEVRSGLETYTRYMIAIGVPMSVGAFLLAEPITVQFFGNEFLPAAPALWILVVAVSILFIYTPANSLIISQATKSATKVTGFTFFFNFITNLIFIPRFGFVAAAVTTALSEMIQTLGYAYFIKKQIVNYHFFRHFIKPIIAVLPMAAVIFVLRDHNLVAVIALGALIYAVSLLIFRFFHKSDWVLFKAAINIRQSVNPDDSVNTTTQP